MKKYEGVIFQVDEKSKGFSELIREVVRQQAKPVNQQLRWTGEKIKLLELGMALFLSGEFNDNELGVTRFLKLWGACFRVDFGVPAQLVDDIMERKRKSRTFFLEHLTVLMREHLTKMDGEDRMPGRSPLRFRLDS